MSALRDDNLRLRSTLSYVRGFMSSYLSSEGDVIRMIDKTLAHPAPSDDAWDALEDVCCGARIQCQQCGKSKPCLCDHKQ